MPEYAVLPAEPCVRLVAPAVHVFILFSEEYFVYNPMDVVRGHFSGCASICTIPYSYDAGDSESCSNIIMSLL